MKRFVAIDDEDRRDLILAGDGVDLSESGEAREARIKGQYMEAMKLFADGDLDGARKSLTEVLDEVEQQKKLKKAWESKLIYLTRRNLAEIEESRNVALKALGHYRAALKEDDTDVVVWLRAGRCAAGLGKLSMARRSFEGGLLVHPNHWLCRRELDRVLSALGELNATPQGCQLQQKRKRAECDEFDQMDTDGEKDVVVSVEKPSWISLVAALSKALRIRLKHHKTCSVRTMLKLTSKEEDVIEDEVIAEGTTLKPAPDVSPSQASSRKRPASSGTQAGSENENERPRTSARQRNMELRREAGRREEQQRKTEQINVQQVLMKFWRMGKDEHNGADEGSQDEGADNAINSDSGTQDAAETRVGQAEKKHVHQFVDRLQNRKFTSIVDILSETLAELAKPTESARAEAIRRTWKALRPHFHHSLLPAPQALAVAEALVPTGSATASHGASGQDAGDAETLKRLYDAEALLSSLPQPPLDVVVGEGVDAVAAAARAAWSKADVLRYKGRVKEASGWYERCDALLTALGREDASRATLGGVQRPLGLDQLREMIQQRLRLMEGATSLEEAKGMLEREELRQILEQFGPKIREALAKGQPNDPHFTAQVQILRIASEKAGDDVAAICCRSIELKLALQEVRREAAMERESGKNSKNKADIMTVLPLLKRVGTKVKEMSARDGEDIIRRAGPCGWNYLDAARFAAGALASAASDFSVQLRRGAAHGPTAGPFSLSTTMRQKRLAMARAVLGYSRAFWFSIRWDRSSTSGQEASVYLLSAVRFALGELAKCRAARPDGTSGVIIKFYASILRERLVELQRSEDLDAGSDDEAHSAAEGDVPLSVWNRSDFCNRELAHCYQVLYRVPVINGESSNWLTRACSNAEEKEASESRGGATSSPTERERAGESGASAGPRADGAVAANSLDATTCGHILDFYRTELTLAVRANRDKNIKKTLDILTELSTALEAEPGTQSVAVLSLEALEDVMNAAWESPEAAETAVRRTLTEEQRGLARRPFTATIPRRDSETVYEVKMLRAGGVMRITENEFKRRKEPERRTDIEEVLDNLVDVVQELKCALRIRPWSLSAWRRLGYVLRDAASVALDINSVLGRAGSHVVEAGPLLRHSIGCFRIVVSLAGQEAGDEDLNGDGEAMEIAPVKKMEEPADNINVNSLDAVVEASGKTTSKSKANLSVFTKCSGYDAAMSLYLLLTCEKSGEERRDQLARQALACIGAAEGCDVGDLDKDGTLKAFRDVDYEDFYLLRALQWFFKYLKGKLEAKLSDGSPVSYLESFEVAAGLQKESEPQRSKKGGASPEVEATYRLRATQMKLLLDGRHSRDEAVLKAIEGNLPTGSVAAGALGSDRLKALAAAVIPLLERCRSKDQQEYGEYYYKGVYYIVLATWRILDDRKGALDKMSCLFRFDAGERGYFYLMWNYRFTDMLRSTFLETERKHRHWRTKCLRLFVELLVLAKDNGRLWSAFQKGRRKFKDYSFDDDTLLLVIDAYANAAISNDQFMLPAEALITVKRAWDAMEETTRILHERKGSGFSEEPAFKSLKQLMEICYAHLDVKDEESDAKTGPSTFNACVKFCAKKWNTDQRIAKRALAGEAELEAGATASKTNVGEVSLPPSAVPGGGEQS